MERRSYGRNKDTRKNENRDITKLSKGKIPVSNKWVFTIKYKANEIIDQYKTRLVAKGVYTTLWN